jgi:iron complex transport system permease protein
MARRTLVLVVGTIVLIVFALTSLALGAVSIPLSQVIDALLGKPVPTEVHEIVLTLRLPRTVAAMLVGAGLAVAGVLLQGALANPLASPDVIGVTGGAGFGATLIILMFADHQALVPAGALVGGLIAAGLVLTIGSAGPRGGSVERLVLAGIAIAALFGAGITSLMVAFPDRVPAAVGFIAGGLVSDGWQSVKTAWPYIGVGMVGALMLAGPLDRLALGDDVAHSLGSRPRTIRLLAGSCAALLAAGAASIAGLLGFLGLIVPHLVRLASGTSNHRFLVPACAICGAAVLVLGDTLARIIVAPIELPVGPLMVLLGVPLFLYLLRKA